MADERDSTESETVAADTEATPTETVPTEVVPADQADPDPEEGRRRQRARFGGINWGAAFFGWLVAVGVAAILTALLTATGAAVGFTEQLTSEATEGGDPIGIAGGVVVCVIAVLAYFAGGYVAGRMSRFDGYQQGFAVWIWAVAEALLLAVIGLIAGSQYNVFSQLNLPRVPIDEGALTTGGKIALAGIVLGSLLGAIAGGLAGQRYHSRVDRAAFEPEPVAEPEPAAGS